MKDISEIVATKKWQFSWDRRMTYQKIRLFSYAYSNAIPKMFGVSLSSELYRVKDFLVSECYDINEYTVGFLVIEKQFADKGSVKLFDELAKLIRSFENDFRLYVEKMPTSYSSYDNKKLLQAYLDFCEVEHQISLPNWVLFVPFEEIITKTLRRTLEAELGDVTRANKIITDLSLPHKMIPLDVHNKSLYEIVLAPVEKRESMIDDLAGRFIHWGTFDVIYPEATRESFVKKLADVEKLDVRKLSAELDEKYRLQKEKTEMVVSDWKNNTYIYGLLNLYSHYANYKDWKNYYREQSSYKLKILLTEISKRIGLSLEQTAFITDVETSSALLGESKLNPIEIDKRIKNSAFVFLDGSLTIVTDESALSKIDTSLAMSKTTEVKGTGAYPGKVRGTVRIIISSNDFGKLKEGDILVTSTTRPDYVPIMEKAAGFVTNEGGLLSHAAIVARELKKPCVIGTKTATKVFKDGDLIEVDAEKGIVRIIK